MKRYFLTLFVVLFSLISSQIAFSETPQQRAEKLLTIQDGKHHYKKIDLTFNSPTFPWKKCDSKFAFYCAEPMKDCVRVRAKCFKPKTNNPERYAKYYLKEMNEKYDYQNLKILNNQEVLLDGHEGYSYTATYTLTMGKNKDRDWKEQSIQIFKKPFMYQFRYSAPVEEFDTYHTDFKSWIRSIQFKYNL